MKSFFRFILLALVLLVVALTSALTAMRFAIHTHEVTVPNLAGKTLTEARRLAESAGLESEAERQFYSATIPAGRIISQAPAPGAKVRSGWEIRVAESLGPQRVEIPSVLGESQRAANLNIRRRGLDIASLAEISLPDSQPDQVVSQNPPANAQDVAAPKVNLLIAQGPQPQAFVTPNFIGQSLANAVATVQASGMKLGNIAVAPQPATSQPTTAPSSSGPLSAQTPPASTVPTPGSIVVWQSPAAGDKILSGAGVSFQVR
jgi:beta-lactam-binding protein with PASTA domain